MLTDLVGPILGDFNGSVYILDSKDSILASRNRENDLTEQDAKQLLVSKTQDGIHDAKLGGEHYTLMQAKSKWTGWSYVIVMPTDQFWEGYWKCGPLYCSFVVQLSPSEF